MTFGYELSHFWESEVDGTLLTPINLSEVCLPFNKKDLFYL